MSSVSLAVVHRAYPDSVRIAALSAAITLNLAVLIVALRPIAPQMSLAFHPSPVPTVRLIEPPAIPTPPKPIVLKPLPPKAAPLPHAVPVQVTPPVVVPTDEGRIAAPPVTTPSLPPTSHTVPVATPTTMAAEVTLAYRSAPLSFPTQALRQHMHGTVLLRVLVDENGKPMEVQVEQSSGYVLLDRSAREQVLANWRFQPAEIQGHAVRAWARVPVSFALQEL